MVSAVRIDEGAAMENWNSILLGYLVQTDLRELELGSPQARMRREWQVLCKTEECAGEHAFSGTLAAVVAVVRFVGSALRSIARANGAEPSRS
jgi:hypothetical protein